MNSACRHADALWLLVVLATLAAPRAHAEVYRTTVGTFSTSSTAYVDVPGASLTIPAAAPGENGPARREAT